LKRNLKKTKNIPGLLPIPTNLKRVTKQNKKGIKQERFGTFEEKQAIRKKLLV
jgi:hypothetical protein